MGTAPDIATEAPPHDVGAQARCPHLVFRNVLGLEAVAGLLRHVTRHEQDFKPAIIYNRRSGEPRINLRQRDCLYLRDLGPFRDRFETFVRTAVPRILAELHLAEAAVEPRELEICAYGDGGHFGAHVDTHEMTDRVRVISCVYYFAASPQRFSGGELRLHGFPVRSAEGATVAPAFVDIAPDTDTLVAFPSWLRHEVLPVRVPSGAWADRRFSVNCWVLRPNRAGEDEPRGY
jgi:Rps23 Pro-64 3,4-dihydroxylase Tpa1-like proline 4-hydroxylase